MESAVFDEDADPWTLHTSDGATTTARFVIAATGLLSAPFFPDIPGRDDFQGESYHTGLWPKEPVDLAGKRVAMIGTGASAVQLLPAIVDEVGSITVYQRTPNWCAPLNNGPITPEEQAEIKASQDDARSSSSASTFAGFAHPDGTEGTFEDTKEQRWAFYEELWNKRGFAKLFSNYNDILVDPRANAEFCEFLAEKIRERVDDPATADKLIPKDHGYGMKRPPMETGYYEAYNRPNVSLVDLHETPIERITETGIVTVRRRAAVRHDHLGHRVRCRHRRAHPDGRGRHRRRSGSRSSGPTAPAPTSGVAIPHFPNFFFVGGPHFPFANVPRGTEIQVDFVTDLVEHLTEHGYARVEPDEAAEEAWTAHVLETAAPVPRGRHARGSGAPTSPARPTAFMLYVGGLVIYRAKLDEVAAQRLRGLHPHEGPGPERLDRVLTPAGGRPVAPAVPRRDASDW